MRKKVTITLSEPGMKIEFIPGGGFPELSFIVDDGDKRRIATITNMADIKSLKAALKDIE